MAPTMVQDAPPVLYDHAGNLIKIRSTTIPNPSPTFFFGSRADGNITSAEVEAAPYKYQWIIYACARAISAQVSRIPVKIQTMATKEEVKSPEITKLLARPNHLMTGKTFMEAASLCLDLKGKDTGGGQCFIVCDSGKEDPRVDLAAGEMPAAMYPYSSDYVKVWEDRNAQGRKIFRGWTFEIPGIPESKINYEPHQIIRIYNYNPYSWYEGISSYQAAKLAVLQDIKSDIWNSQTYDNDAVPSGILTADGFLNEEQMDQYRKGWYERYGGPGNARRVAVLGGGLKFQAIANNAKDMEFIKQKESVRDEIISVFGLNKIAIGNYEQINYATIVEGRRMLMEDVYLPRHQHITEAINVQWLHNVNTSSPMELVEDVLKIQVLKRDMKPQAEASKTLVDQGYPASLAARITEIPLTDQDLKDYPWLDEEPKRAPTFGELPGAAPKPADSKPLDGKAARVVYTKGEREKISMDYIERVLDPGERNFRRKLIDLFMSQRNRMQDSVDEWLRRETGQKAERTVVVTAQMFTLDVKPEDEAILKTYRPLLLDQLKRDRAKLKEELGSLVEWNVTDDLIDQYVADRAQVLYGINDTTFKEVEGALVDILKEGEEINWTVQEYAREIKDSIGDTIEARKGNSLSIARTETGSISSKARFDAFGAEGIEYGQWLSAHDERVRVTHQMADGEVRRIGDMYPYVDLRFPLDPMGRVGEIVNCVLPGTMVSGRIVAGLKAWYSGKAVEVTTRSGYRLCVTINHPIATASGWQSADSIHKGDRVICNRGNVNGCFSRPDNQEQYRKACVEDVFDALSAQGPTRVHSPTALDLDGDGQFITGKIHTVEGFASLGQFGGTFNSELVLERKTSLREDINECSFILSDRPKESSGLTSLLSGYFGDSIVSGSPSRSPCSRTLTNDEVGVFTKETPLQVRSIGSAANLDISRYEYPTYDVAGYAEFIGDLFLTHSPQVFFDDVISVKVFDFCGHVYDLQSSVGYFDTNNILSRNCRCVLLASETSS